MWGCSNEQPLDSDAFTHEVAQNIQEELQRSIVRNPVQASTILKNFSEEALQKEMDSVQSNKAQNVKRALTTVMKNLQCMSQLFPELDALLDFTSSEFKQQIKEELQKYKTCSPREISLLLTSVTKGNAVVCNVQNRKHIYQLSPFMAKLFIKQIEALPKPLCPAMEQSLKGLRQAQQDCCNWWHEDGSLDDWPGKTPLPESEKEEIRNMFQEYCRTY
ncbi:MAG: hypothetical protein AAF320_03660 [Myxococcota bacterium]